MKKAKPFDFHQAVDDSPANRRQLFHALVEFDEPFHAPGMQRRGMPFFLGVTRNGKLAFMTGSDAKDSFKFLIGKWTPWSGVTRIDLPVHEIRWVNHI